eukprot:COSAG01_NODE_376_length_17942_cov_1753.560164_17_plen_265_part_00
MVRVPREPPPLTRGPPPLREPPPLTRAHPTKARASTPPRPGPKLLYHTSTAHELVGGGEQAAARAGTGARRPPRASNRRRLQSTGGAGREVLHPSFRAGTELRMSGGAKAEARLRELQTMPFHQLKALARKLGVPIPRGKVYGPKGELDARAAELADAVVGIELTTVGFMSAEESRRAGGAVMATAVEACFDSVDLDGDGSLTTGELGVAFQQLGIQLHGHELAALRRECMHAEHSIASIHLWLSVCIGGACRCTSWVPVRRCS